MLNLMIGSLVMSMGLASRLLGIFLIVHDLTSKLIWSDCNWKRRLEILLYSATSKKVIKNSYFLNFFPL